MHCDLLSKKWGVPNLLTPIGFKLMKEGDATTERLKNCHVKLPELFT